MNDELIAKTPIGVRLAWVEYSSDKQCLQTIAYGDGNADDFTHLIEHVHILKTFE